MREVNRCSQEKMEFDELPGFRFHPTEQELLDFYLTKAVSGQDMVDIIGFLNIYNHEPWDLPGTVTVILLIICISIFFLGEPAISARTC